MNAKNFIIGLVLIVTIVGVTIVGCTNKNTAYKALLDAGYSNIVLTGYDAWACGEDDDFADGFSATGPSGRQVRGVVCSGLTKGATIRLK